MEKKIFQKPEVKFVKMSTMNIIATSPGDETDNSADGWAKKRGGQPTFSSPKSSTSIPTSSSANWD